MEHNERQRLGAVVAAPAGCFRVLRDVHGGVSY